MEIVLQIIMCVSGTLAFAITMNSPKSSLIYIVAGSTVTASIERLLSLRQNDFTACLTAMLVLFFYCEIIARLTKKPKTIILLPSTIPLLPGSSIYYTMLYIIRGDGRLALQYGKATVLAGLGIALGAVIASAVLTLRHSDHRDKL